jgi:hypothetical protein
VEGDGHALGCLTESVLLRVSKRALVTVDGSESHSIHNHGRYSAEGRSFLQSIVHTTNQNLSLPQFAEPPRLWCMLEPYVSHVSKQLLSPTRVSCCLDHMAYHCTFLLAHSPCISPSTGHDPPPSPPNSHILQTSYSPAHCAPNHTNVGAQESV